MPTRISTGIRVQATSIRVLWVVRDGIGLALALNLTITAIRSASTNSVMMVMRVKSSQLWNQLMSSMTGVADCCSVYSHGAGCPNSANAAPLVASATPATANPSNCRPIWLFDIFMPFALPSKSSPEGTSPRATMPKRSAPCQTA